MDTNLIILAVVEFVALLLIVRLWWRRAGGVGSRIVWTFVLLIPLVGVIFYAVSRPGPERHPFDPPESTGMYDPGA